MAKIVIIAPAGAEDVEDAVKLLKAAGHDVETEEPTPKSLLHIVLGLLGPNAYGFGPGYAYAPGPQADDEPVEADPEAGLDAPEADVPAEDDPFADDVSFDAAADDFNFESATVDGEPITAKLHPDEHSVLVVEELSVGPRTTYRLNESSFSFWPADQAKPMQRVDVGYEKWHTSVELEVQQGEKTELLVGQDLLEIFGKKNSSFKDLKTGWSAVYAFNNGKSDVEVSRANKGQHDVAILDKGKLEKKVMSSAEVEAMLKKHGAKFTHAKDHNN